MDERTNTAEGAPVETALAFVELGKWMGRRDAFGQMAARASAAEIESLRQIHDGKLYQRLNCTWVEFCAQYLGVSARTVDRELAHFRRFGPAFFTVRQLARISAREYAAIADCITEEGVRVNGETIPLDPQNSVEVAEAVKALLEQNGPVERIAPAENTFGAAIERFLAASETVRSFEERLDPRRARTVGMELASLLAAAAGWGVDLRFVQEQSPSGPRAR